MRLAALLILIFAAAIETSSAAWKIYLHDGRRHVSIDNVAEFYQLKRTAFNGKKFTLSAGGKEIRGTAGSREIYINNVKFILCFPLVERDGTVLVSAMDVTKIIEPVLRPGKIRNAGPLRTVVLDPGHGGHDSGATSQFGREKDFTLDTALRARKLLQQAGYNVVMTRSTDVFIPLEKRAQIANKYPSAIFISIHYNKSQKTDGTGIETYCLAPRGVPSMDKEQVSFSDLRAHPGNARDPENIALATMIHSAMLRHLNMPDRGIKRARFSVIRNVTIPGVLIEGGFVQNPRDGRLIANPEYRQRIAQSVLDAVNNYRRLVAGQAVPSKPNLVVTAENDSSASAAPPPPPENTPKKPQIGASTPLDRAVAGVKFQDSSDPAN